MDRGWGGVRPPAVAVGVGEYLSSGSPVADVADNRCRRRHVQRADIGYSPLSNSASMRDLRAKPPRVTT